MVGGRGGGLRLLVLVPLLVAGAAAPAVGLDEVVTKRVVRVRDLPTLSGQVVPLLELGVETYGRLNATRDNVVLIGHFLAGDGHAAGRLGDASGPVGWWDALIGPGLAIDTNRLFVVSLDLPCNMKVKSPAVVTTGPSTVDPRTGRRYGLDFPAFGVRDMVRAQRAALDALGVRRLVAVIGPSMGGMLAWQWAVEFPDHMDLIVPASAPITFSASQRAGMQAAAAAVRADPQWAFGAYADLGTDPSLGVAMAMQGLSAIAAGPVAQWSFWLNLQRHLADARRFDANHYLSLIDLHLGWDLGSELGSREAAYRRIRARVLVLGSQDDDFVTPALLREATGELQAAGASARLVLVAGRNGHLSVLDDARLFGPALAQELARVTP
ncbi:MAG: alpha/beta fold hydrolase [Planctomycetes bacterium]|nr:alpha/beta fold hydrolase [Planctomycetota bacterium]